MLDKMASLSSAMSNFSDAIGCAMGSVYGFAELAQKLIQMDRMTRAYAYGTLRSYSVPHVIARFAAQRVPTDCAWRLAYGEPINVFNLLS